MCAKPWPNATWHVVVSALSSDENKMPDDVKFEVIRDEVVEQGRLREGPYDTSSSSSEEFKYDEETKTMKVPLSALQDENSTRRSRLVTFTCNKCGGRTTRAVNPVAWEKGMVMGQCGTCQVWHVLAAKNAKIYEEIRFKDKPSAEEESASDGSGNNN